MDLKRNRVEDTNDSAVVSKHSMATKGYVFDPFLIHFVSDKDVRRSRSPLINRFYYLRFKAIENAINRLKGLKLIVSIGCGFDTSSLRLPNISFIEIDFPYVVTNKAKVMVDKQLVCDQNFLNKYEDRPQNDKPFVALKTDNYCLIGADLRKDRELKHLFIDHKLLETIDKTSKICLFNECSLCYLKQEESDKIIKTFIELFEDKCHSITYLSFEQLKPNQSNDGLSKVMLKHFQTIGSPLKTFLTKSEIIRRFQNLNFKSIQVLDMKRFYDCYIDSKERQRIDSIEMFDEYEEFDSVANCYAITIAQNVSQDMVEYDINEQRVGDDTQTQIDSIVNSIIMTDEIKANLLLSRFGHSSCLTNNNNIVVFGGFGCDSDIHKMKTSHKRLSNFIEINTKTFETKEFISAQSKSEIKGIHSQMVELNDQQFLVSGGRLSPNSFLDHKIIKLCADSQTYEIQSSLDSTPKVFRHLMIKLKNSNKVIQFGGKQSICRTESEINSYYVIDLNTLESTTVRKTKLFSDIHSLSGTALNSNVFVTNGGLTCDSTNSFASNHLNLIDERMSSINIIILKNLCHLYSHQIQSLDENRLLIVGGISKCHQNNRIDLIDLRFNKIVDSLDIKTQSILMLTNFSSQLIPANDCSNLWLIGGGGNCFSFGTHFNHSFVFNLH